MKAEIDYEKCIVCQLCASICPKVFEYDEKEMKIKVVKDCDADDECKSAEESCPVEAIKLSD